MAVFPGGRTSYQQILITRYQPEAFRHRRPRSRTLYAPRPHRHRTVSAMDWGVQNRIARILQPQDGRTVMLAVDHGYFLGPTHRLENPRATIAPLLPYADALMLTRGVLRTSVDPDTDTPMVLRVSGGTSVLQEDLSHETITTSVGKELEKRDARYLSLACRIAAEHGARLVKTYYCEGFAKVAESCPVPVIIAGGPKLATDLDALEMTRDALEAGAVGVDMGRNIWQHDTPVPMIRAVRAIVHEKATVKEAAALLR